MSMMPSRHCCPSTKATAIFDSFHGSFCNFHRFGCLQICRYSSSLCLKPHSSPASGSVRYQNPSRKFNYTTGCGKPRHSSINLSVGGSRRDGDGDWLDNWNKTQKINQPKPPRIVVNYRKGDNFWRLRLSKSDNASTLDSDGSTTMDKIVEKLKKFGYMDDGSTTRDQIKDEDQIEKGSVEDIFYVEEGMLPNTRGGFSKESPFGLENVSGSNGEVRFPWEKRDMNKKESREGKETARRESRFSLAEMTLPEPELRRLRNLTFQIKNKMKVGGAGVTQDVVNKIHERWKTSEIVRIKIDGAPALNMRRMHEILERKTGGLVIWRSGTSVSLYRGVSYEVPSLKLQKRIYKSSELLSPSPSSSPTSTINVSVENSNVAKPNTETADVEKTERESKPEVEYEDEVDKMLEGLGPRYKDWQGCNPLPVDADLLPGLVPGYQPPFRVLPYGVRPTLGQREGTGLRRLARVLPPHFALGRSRQLQGLAVAMIKVWEKSSVAKIALKRGVQLTTSERMAEELKKLTGGVLLSRNKDFLVFYRGKNFLSREVAEALLEKERLVKSLQDEEEQARLRSSSTLVAPTIEVTQELAAAGTLGETLNATARWGRDFDDDDYVQEVKREVEMSRHANIVRKLERKLAFAEKRLLKAERALCKVEEFLKPAENKADPESITDEERFMFRKLGLKMQAFLLLGRRGVFDGTVENMHLHWKYRELIKIIMKAKSIDQVKRVASALEAESGGNLISIDKVSKGYAIIVYRGKDYKRPSTLRPGNLLTKRKALARSKELQRREALTNHISGLLTRVEQLKSEIEQVGLVNEKGDEELYDKLDAAYPSSDEEIDADGERDCVHLETYDSENDNEEEDEEEEEDEDEDGDEDEPKEAGLTEACHLETNLYLHSSGRESEEPETELDSS